jgi:hypothetical protein
MLNLLIINNKQDQFSSSLFLLLSPKSPSSSTDPFLAECPLLYVGYLAETYRSIDREHGVEAVGGW